MPREGASPRASGATARHFLATAVVSTALGFLLGFWFRGPSEARAISPEALGALQRLHADTDRLLQEQRALLRDEAAQEAPVDVQDHEGAQRAMLPTSPGALNTNPATKDHPR